MTSLFNTDYKSIKAQTDQHIGRVHQLTIDTGNKEMIQIITDLRNRLNDPFMFVIVGEVKAGKSSFINALLEVEQDICAVAPSPMTDTIQQITYGDKPSEQILGPFLKRIYRPVEILKDIAIVDTPGTNTIISHHQEITENFIPSADLIVFVFEAKNPYRQSAWEFFKLITEEWRKKIIFVLQQKDLMPLDDLLINQAGVIKHAKENGIDNPKVFSVSAKLEKEKKKEESGYIELRKYIKENITGGKAPYLKLESSLNTTQTFLTRIKSALSLRKDQLVLDKAFRTEINIILQEQAARSHRQVSLMVDHLISSYDHIWNEKRADLSKGLSFVSLMRRSFSSIFNKKQNIKTWLNDLSSQIETDMQDKLYLRLSSDVNDLAEAIQNMVKFIDLKIQQTPTVLSNDMVLFREIAEQRSNILKDLQSTFQKYVQNQDNFKNEKLFPQAKEISPNVATGSGIAIIGIVLTAVTNTAVLDITGGIVTTIGLLFAGITVGINKRKVLRQFDEEMLKGKNTLQSNLGENLNIYIDGIKEKIEFHFKALDTHIENEAQNIVSSESVLNEEIINGNSILETLRTK